MSRESTVSSGQSLTPVTDSWRGMTIPWRREGVSIRGRLADKLGAVMEENAKLKEEAIRLRRENVAAHQAQAISQQVRHDILHVFVAPVCSGLRVERTAIGTRRCTPLKGSQPLNDLGRKACPCRAAPSRREALIRRLCLVPVRASRLLGPPSWGVSTAMLAIHLLRRSAMRSSPTSRPALQRCFALQIRKALTLSNVVRLCTGVQTAGHSRRSGLATRSLRGAKANLEPRTLAGCLPGQRACRTGKVGTMRSTRVPSCRGSGRAQAPTSGRSGDGGGAAHAGAELTHSSALSCRSHFVLRQTPAVHRVRSLVLHRSSSKLADCPSRSQTRRRRACFGSRGDLRSSLKHPLHAQGCWQGRWRH